MARFSAYGASAATSSTTLPHGTLYAPAGNGLILREVGIFNTGTTAMRYKLVRLTTAGTVGTALTENKFWADGPVPTGTAYLNSTGTAPTLGTDIAAMPVGAAAGAGTILTFYGEGNGIYIPTGVANGVGLLQVVGAAFSVDFYFIWDE